MTTPSPALCADANTVVYLFTEGDGGASRVFWEDLRATKSTVIAPSLLRYEVANAFYRLARSRAISEVDASNFLKLAFELPISYYDDPALASRAVHFAKRFDRPTTYDAQYLALSESQVIDFWTGDKRLYNSVHHHLPWVHLVGE